MNFFDAVKRKMGDGEWWGCPFCGGLIVQCHANSRAMVEGHECRQMPNNSILEPTTNPVPTDDRHTFTSGAMSSGQKPRYDLIPQWALERIARRFELGASKYGEDNWTKGVGDRDFILDRINHAIDHLHCLADLIKAPIKIDYDKTDDDAAAVILNAIFVMGYQRASK